MVEQAALEMQCRGNSTEGSNPSLSATDGPGLLQGCFILASVCLRSGLVEEKRIDPPEMEDEDGDVDSEQTPGCGCKPRYSVLETTVQIDIRDWGC